jgi:hypothetical protein
VVLLIEVVVHRVDTATQRTVPPGWRWCVHAGGEPYDDPRRMLNAGWCASRSEACVTGEMVGVAVAKALRLVRYPVEYRGVVDLASDPIPVEV